MSFVAFERFVVGLLVYLKGFKKRLPRSLLRELVKDKRDDRLNRRFIGLGMLMLKYLTMVSEN